MQPHVISFIYHFIFNLMIICIQEDICNCDQYENNKILKIYCQFIFLNLSLSIHLSTYIYNPHKIWSGIEIGLIVYLGYLHYICVFLIDKETLAISIHKIFNFTISSSPQLLVKMSPLIVVHTSQGKRVILQYFSILHITNFCVADKAKLVRVLYLCNTCFGQLTIYNLLNNFDSGLVCYIKIRNNNRV